MKLVPINISAEIDTIGIIVTSILLGFVAAKIYRSRIFNGFLFTVCNIHGTTDSYIWDSIINNNYPVMIEIVTQDDLLIKGFTDLVEEHTDAPHIMIANYTIIDKDGAVVETPKQNQTLFFDLKNAKYYKFKFYKNDPKREELKELMENRYEDYEK